MEISKKMALLAAGVFLVAFGWFYFAGRGDVSNIGKRTDTVRDELRRADEEQRDQAGSLDRAEEAVRNSADRAGRIEENERRDLREELESALQSLEPRDRMLLTLTFLEGYSIAETAAMMDMTPINVRVRVHRSKAKLREALDPPLESLGRQS